ncbi:hypothetical protein [Trichormus azollae]|uniref:hypothetical protein n=1 Tax=Trichormus azollae TaxID=1164 RepID=UPI0016516FE0
MDFPFWYTLKIPFYHFFHTKLIFLTGLLRSEALAEVVEIADYLVLPIPPVAMD